MGILIKVTISQVYSTWISWINKVNFFSENGINYLSVHEFNYVFHLLYRRVSCLEYKFQASLNLEMFKKRVSLIVLDMNRSY